MNPPSPARLIPPRPIPDPLPWPGFSFGTTGLVLGTAALALFLIGLVVLFRSRRGRRPTEIPSFGPPPAPPGGLVERAERIRSALVHRFGASWAARTTEEIAGSPPLIDLFGPDRTAELVEYLRLADQAKFAPAGEPPTPDPAVYGDPWLSDSLARLAG